MDISKCTERIRKVGENHILVEYLLYNAKGEEIVVEIKEYGQNAIDEMKTKAEEEKASLEALKDTKVIDAKITAVQVTLDKATALDSEMNKEILKNE
jgi:hypothetical protein